MSKMKIELNYEGVGQLLRSAAMEEFLLNKTREIQARCGSGYSVDSKVIKDRVVSSVYTQTAEAKQDNIEHNTLLKELY